MIKRTGIIISDFNLDTRMNHWVSFLFVSTLENFQRVKNNPDLYFQLQDEILTMRI